MGKFQIILLLSVVTCAIISSVQSVPLSDDASVQSENAAKCKKLCGFCGCTGYYCGDECLCECNSITDGEAQCVDTMKSNCKKLALPFEVLIQGPNRNRMVRSLLYANPDEEVCVQSSESNKEKRSTISIYKPDEIQQNDETVAAPGDDEQKTYEEDSLIHVIVGQKLDTEIYPVKTESTPQDAAHTQIMLENVENRAADSESNQYTDGLRMPSAVDSIDRTNTKRHIIDVNQEIAEFENSHFGDSFLYKRDAAEEAVAAPQDESVAAPKDEAVEASPPSKPVLGPLLPKLRAAIDAIPTADEISKAWEAFRYDVNLKITNAQQIAQQKAAELRAKINPSSLPPKPAFAPKFNPAGFRAAVPLLPNKNEWKKNDWNKNDWNKNNNKWLTPWVGQALDDSVGSPQAEGSDDSVGAAAPPAPAESP